MQTALQKEIIKLERCEVQFRKLSYIVEQIPVTVVVTDIKGNIEYVNPKFTQLTGYTFKEAIGQNPSILKSGKTPPEEYERLWENITSGREWNGELCNKKKNGELYWESVSISPIRNIEGVITHFVAVKEDITERKSIENTLRESEEKYRKLIDTANDAIFLMDVETGIIIDVNKRAEELLGMPVKEIVGMNHAQIYPPEDVNRNIKLFKIYTQIDNAITSEEIFVQHKDDRKIPVEISSSVIELDGKKVIQCIFRDITERKKSKELLQEQRNVLEQKNIALGEVLGQIGLEKKQIADNIIANAENLLLPIIEKLKRKGQLRGYVQLLQKNLQELTSSFGKILTEKKARLTSREIEICNMIRNGLTSKEIANLLNTSRRTTEKHRTNIRKKLGIINKNINLSSFLKTL